MSGYDQLADQVGSIFASSWWLDAVAPSRWRPHLLEERGVAVAAWPTVVRTTRWGEVHEGARLTPFLGPLLRLPGAAVPHWGEQLRLLNALIEAIGPVAAIDARCHPDFDYWMPLAWHGFTQTTSYTWRLEDLSDPAAVFAHTRENVRREVRKAAKRGVTVSPGTLDELLAVHARTAAQQRIADAPSGRATLRRVDAAAAPRGARSILIARDRDGRIHAGAYLVHDRRYTYYLVGGSDSAVRTSGAVSATIWAAIELAAERGTGFDFEGSSLRTVERFFRAFGGRPVPCSRVRLTGSRGLAAEVAAKRAVLRMTPAVTLTLSVPAAFAAQARWTVETLLTTCAGDPDVVYPGPALPGSELAWRLFESGGGTRPALTGEGLLDFGDGVADLIASAFWHLSRWEERAGAEDAHGRFPRRAALADPERPAVDALADRFRSAIGAAAAGRRFTVALTHDIDTPWRWYGRRAVLGALARTKAAAAGRDRAELAVELRGLAAAPLHRLRGTDPNWVFDRIADIERRHGGRSTYFVMAGHTDPADGPSAAAYDRRRAAVVSAVLGQGDELALHPSYRASQRPQLIEDERERLVRLAGGPVAGVRFHYLRHRTHRTLPLLDRMGFAYDSSQGYADSPGLRAGFSHPYRPFDLAAGAPLAMLELPLAVMDATLAERRYLHLAPEAALARATSVLERVAAAAGTVSVLWHNDRFDPAYGRGWDRVYDRLLAWVVERGGRLTTAADAVAPYRRPG